MIHDQGLPLFLWVEACNTFVYLQNRSPHKSLGDLTHEEVFCRKRPQLAHLRIFGCVIYSQVPKEKRTKLDPTAEKGIFVGYSETSKAYEIYIPTVLSVVVRRDVRFEEDKAFRRSRELGDKEPSTIQQSASQVTGGQGTRGTTVTLIGPSVRS